MRRHTLLAAIAVAAVAAGMAPAAASGPAEGAAAAAYDTDGAYSTVGQHRLMDTRVGLGGNALRPREVRAVQTADDPFVGVAGVTALVVNLTLVRPTRSGYLTAYPGPARPLASSINFPAGWTGANMVTVPLATDGSFRLYNSAGTTNVVIDVLGYYRGPGTSTATRGALYHPMTPRRIFDSRKSSALKAGEDIRLRLDFGSRNKQVWSLAVNVTVTGATSKGYVKVWDGWSVPLGTSTVNFGPHSTVANMAVTPASINYTLGEPTSGWTTIGILNASGGKAQVIVDLVGVFVDQTVPGYRFEPVAPVRAVDSRTGTGTARRPIGPGEARLAGAPSPDWGVGVAALATNLTTIKPTRRTYLTVWNGATTRPWVSNTNVAAGHIVASSAFIPIRPDRTFKIYNAAGSVNVAVDVGGLFRTRPTDSTPVSVPLSKVIVSRG
jgi:serine protease